MGNRTRAVVCCCSCALPLHETSTKHRRTQSTANNNHTKLFSTAAYSDRQRVRAYKCMCNKIKSASKIFMNESNLLRPFPLLPTFSSPPASSDRTPCSFSFNGVLRLFSLIFSSFVSTPGFVFFFAADSTSPVTWSRSSFVTTT